MPQSLSRVITHLIFSTNDRQRWLALSFQSELHAYLHGALNNLGCPSLQVGGVEDHVHLLFGLSRKAATEFSFFLAVPTLIAAGLYDLYKHRDLLSAADLPVFGVGLVSAFISAFVCVRWLIRYITTHDFTIFAWYRIAFGLLLLWVFRT